MRWTPGGSSEDVEDRRDDDSGGGGGFGGSGIGGIHLGVGGTIIVLILSAVFHQNFFALISGGGPGPGSGAPVESRHANPALDAREAKLKDFITFVLNDVQHTWETLLPAQTNAHYHHAKLVLFRDETQSPCGEAQSAMGPFYCPGDEKVYIDLGFYDELSQRFGAPGEFAQAYVLAHEIGHHVQKILGTEQKVRRLQESDPSETNVLSVRLELQADCYAGVWGYTTQQRNLLDPGDIDSGMKAAAAVGDDRLQRMGRGRVNPESFTHGTSAQRTSWLKKGLETGQIASCNTFQRK
jgi:predicted metalloprotease